MKSKFVKHFKSFNDYQVYQVHQKFTRPFKFNLKETNDDKKNCNFQERVHKESGFYCIRKSL